MDLTWREVCRKEDVPSEGALAIKIDGWQLLLVQDGDIVLAYNDRCPHQAARLSPGKVRRGAIMCPLHGARFRIETGECIGGTYSSLRRFAVRILEDMIEVEVPVCAPGPADLPVDPPS